MNPIEQLVQRIDEHGLWEKTIVLSRNEFLKVRGSVDTNVYYVVSGCLRIFLVDDVEEHTIRFGYQGNLIAALDSYISGKPSALAIQALKRTELRVISKISFKKFVEHTPEDLRRWNILLENLILQQMEREQDLLISSPQERYSRVLKRSPRLFQEIPHKYIASYLRMTPETLSRIKKS